MNYLDNEKFTAFAKAVEVYLTDDSLVMETETISALCEEHRDAIYGLFSDCQRLNVWHNTSYFNRRAECDNDNLRVDFTNRYKTWSLIIHGDLDEDHGDIRTLVRKHHQEGYRYFELSCSGEEAVLRFVDFSKATKLKNIPCSDSFIEYETELSSNIISDIVNQMKLGCMRDGNTKDLISFSNRGIDEYLLEDIYLAADYMVCTGLQTKHDKNMFMYNGMDETFSEQSTVYFVPLKNREKDAIEMELKLQLLYKDKTKGYSVSSHCNITVEISLGDNGPEELLKFTLQPSTGHAVYFDFN